MASAVRSDVAQMLREIAGPVEPGTSLKAIWRDLATRLRISVGQVTRLWYGLWQQIPAHIYLTVRHAWDRKSYVATVLSNNIDARAAGFEDRRRRVEARRA